MDYKKLLENFSVAIISQGVGFILSAITALIVPKVLGITEYGYWQLFIFYTSYTGFFHLGLNDGFYLLKSGQTRNSLDERDLKSQFSFCAVLQLCVAIGIVICAMLFPLEEERQFIICLTAIFLILNNTSLFLGFSFQALNETKLYSYSVMIDKILFLIPLSVLLVSGNTDFKPYVVFYVASKTCSLVYCLVKAKDLLREKPYTARESIKRSFMSIKVGIVLMLSGIAGSLILGIARFVIDYKWGINAFGEVSLALSIMTFFLAFISQASMVLFPALKHSEKKESLDMYSPIRDISGLAFSSIYLFYYPVAFVVGLWLPQYSNILVWLAIFLPACVFDGKMNLCSTTYFKVIRKEKIMLGINFGAMSASIFFSLFAAFVINSITAVIFTAVIAIILRAVISEKYLERRLLSSRGKLVYSEIALAVAFICLVYLAGDNYIAGETISCILYLAFLIINKSISFPYFKKILTRKIKS